MLKGLALAVALLCSSGTAHAALLFGVDGSNQLVSFDSANPSVYLSTVQVSSLNGNLVAIDFRPVNNVLFGYTNNAALVTINLATGVATQIGTPNPVAGSSIGFDFNSMIDRIRLVTDADTNSVLNPNDGTRTTATGLAFAAGDPNFGANPNVVAAAYNTARPLGTSPTSPGGPNQLFVIDSNLDILARLNNNGGVLNTVGALGFNLGNGTSFDIDSDDIGFVQDRRDLFTINLTNGSLTSIGQTRTPLFAISAFRNVPGVPEPSTWGMMLVGFGAVGFSLRKAKRRSGAVSAHA